MNIVRLLQAFSKSKILSFSSLLALLNAIKKHGINLMALLQFAEKKYSKRIALVDDTRQLTYRELLHDSLQVTHYLHKTYQVASQQKIAVICRNHSMLVKLLFALSRLGTSVYFIHTELSQNKLKELTNKHQFDAILYDIAFEKILDASSAKQLICLADFDNREIDSTIKIQRQSTSKLNLLTSGTTGVPKDVAHKPSLFNYLPPFLGMVEKLKLVQRSTCYIATPIYHGYGLAVLLLFLTLGKKVVITETFKAGHACTLIETHQIDMMTAVPLMLRKMLIVNHSQLVTLRCIASGGAPLSPLLIKNVQEQLGNILFNLYGTSETGLNFIATPEDLAYNLKTLGKGIKGMKYKLVKQQEEDEVYELLVKGQSTMLNSQDDWLRTGDLAYKDRNGYYFLAGRVDDMIISGGINVYPLQVENAILQHPDIEDVAVIGIDDEEFGQRLHAFIQTKPNSSINPSTIQHWLKTNVSRYEMPKYITFIEAIPYTPLWKKDKKQIFIMQQLIKK